MWLCMQADLVVPTLWSAGTPDLQGPDLTIALDDHLYLYVKYILSTGALWPPVHGPPKLIHPLQRLTMRHCVAIHSADSTRWPLRHVVLTVEGLFFAQQNNPKFLGPFLECGARQRVASRREKQRVTPRLRASARRGTQRAYIMLWTSSTHTP